MYTNQFAKERFSPQEQWLKENILLETIVGSYAYGCQTDESDYDIVSIEYIYINNRKGLIFNNYLQ